MATSFALKFISSKNDILCTGFCKQETLLQIPVSIQQLFLIYYIEYDQWIKNPAVELSNLNTRIKHLLHHTYSHIYGTVIMDGKQFENIIYEWKLQIHSITNYSLEIGIINCKYLQTTNPNDEIVYSWRATVPFGVYYKNKYNQKTKQKRWLSLKAQNKLPWIRSQDIITISIRFTINKPTEICFKQNDITKMSFSGINPNYKYQLFVGMGKSSHGDSISILDFHTVPC